MRLVQSYLGPHFRKIIHTDFWLFEYAIWLHAVGRAMIAVFVPILLFRIGFPLRTVIIYYVLFNLLDVPLNFFAEKLVMRIGARKVIIFATLISITYFSILANLSGPNLIVLFALAALDALYDTSYWVAHVYLFLKSSRSEHSAGKQTGILYAIRTLAAAFGPLIGALILLFGSSRGLISASIFFFALSLIPLFRLRHTADHPRHDGMAFREFFDDPIEKRTYLTTFLLSVNAAADGLLWPLFIYTIFGTTESAAYVAIAISVGAAAFSYATGLVEEHGRLPIIVIGAILGALTWVLRLAVPSNIVYFGSVAVMGFFVLLVQIPNDSTLYARAREGASLRAAAYRNAASMTGYLTTFLLLLFLPDTFHSAFVIAACAFLAIAGLTLKHALSKKPRAVAG